MAYNRFNKKYSGNYCGWSSRGTHLTAIAIRNDIGLNTYVLKNKQALLSLPKEDKLSLIKRNAKSSWAKSDLKEVNTYNVKASELNQIIRDLGE